MWAPLWESTEVQCQYPLGTMLQLEGLKGFENDDWGEEVTCLKLFPGRTFRAWIGLMQPVGESIGRRLQDKKNGTLIFPIKVEGKLGVKLVPL